MPDARPTIHLLPCLWLNALADGDQGRSVGRALDLMLQYLASCAADRGFCFVVSGMDCLRAFLGVHGEQRAVARDLVSTGRLEAGGPYVQVDLGSVQGETLVRNLVYGRLSSAALLGAEPHALLLLGASGDCRQLSQLAAQAGYGALILATRDGGGLPLGHALGPDGTLLLEQREGYPHLPSDLSGLLADAAEGLSAQVRAGLRDDLRLLGAEMSPLPGWLEDRREELARHDPAVVFGTAKQFFVAVGPQAHHPRAHLPLLAAGSRSGHAAARLDGARVGAAARLAENRLLSAETWGTLAGLAGANYPDCALDKAWRQVLFAQQAPPSLGTALPDRLAACREALELAQEVEGKALSYLTARVNTRQARAAPREGAALVVFNPLGWERTDICRARITLDDRLAAGFRLVDESGREVPLQVVSETPEGSVPSLEIAFLARAVPSVGYRTYHLIPGRDLPRAAEPIESSRAVMENEFLSVRAEAPIGGGLTSIYDKRAKRELIAPEAFPANEVVALGPMPGDDAGWPELLAADPLARSRDAQARMTLTTGPVFSQVRVTSQLSEECEIVQEIALHGGLPRIDLRTTIRWRRSAPLSRGGAAPLQSYRGESDLVALSFPLALRGARPTSEQQFAVVVEQTGVFVPAQSWVEVGTTPALRIGGGAKSAAAVPLSPCAVITSGGAQHRAAARALAQALLSQGVVCTALTDEEGERDAAPCALHISLGQGNAYSRLALAAVPGSQDRLAEMLAKGQWGGVLVSRPDPSDQSRGLLVLVADTADPGGIPRLAELLSAAVAADELHLPEACNLSGSADPVDDYGVALIGRGPLLAGVRGDGTLLVPLLRGSDQPPRVFEHSLLPHPGDWRLGGVVRANYEYNRPLVALQAPLQDGPLPGALSLLRADALNAVITAVKPAGNPLAEHVSPQGRLPDRAVTVRLYESEGRATSALLAFGSPPGRASTTDLLERRRSDLAIGRGRWRRMSQVSLDLRPCEMATLGVELAPLCDAPGQAVELGPIAEPCQPVYSLWWDHNAGAAPIGNQPVTLWMRGTVPPGKNTRFALGLSNDALDREITGMAEVSAPAEWTLIPRQVPYRIPAGSQALYEIMVVPPADASGHFIRATTSDGRQLVQGVLPVGEVAPLTVSLRREGPDLLVQLKNSNPDYVEGQATLITPPEWWGSAAGSAVLGEVSPSRRCFRLEAGEEQTLSFGISGDADGLWAIARVAWYGNVQYAALRAAPEQGA